MRSIILSMRSIIFGRFWTESGSTLTQRALSRLLNVCVVAAFEGLKVPKHDGFLRFNDGCCTKNDGFYTKNDGFYTKMMDCILKLMDLKEHRRRVKLCKKILLRAQVCIKSRFSRSSLNPPSFRPHFGQNRSQIQPKNGPNSLKLAPFRRRTRCSRRRSRSLRGWPAGGSRRRSGRHISWCRSSGRWKTDRCLSEIHHVLVPLDRIWCAFD